MDTRRALLAAGLLLAAGNTAAQAVYKCVEKGKPVSFQTTPCPATAKIAAIREYTPDRELTPQEKRRREAQWATRKQMQAQAAASMPIQQASTVDHCAMVKADRDRWERAVGMNRSYETLRAWNERVAHACR